MMTNEEIIKVIEDLLKSHEALMPGIGGLVVDIGFMNEALIAADVAVRTLKADE
jgi:hypothetical protein